MSTDIEQILRAKLDPEHRLLDALLVDVWDKTRAWRANAGALSFLALLAPILLLKVAPDVAGHRLADLDIGGAVLLLAVVAGLWALVRSFWSIAHAYATRAGQLEDIRLVLDLKRSESLEADTALKLVAGLRRGHMGEVLQGASPRVEFKLPAAGDSK
jgi:hypothetical protein